MTTRAPLSEKDISLINSYRRVKTANAEGIILASNFFLISFLIFVLIVCISPEARTTGIGLVMIGFLVVAFLCRKNGMKRRVAAKIERAKPLDDVQKYVHSEKLKTVDAAGLRYLCYEFESGVINTFIQFEHAPPGYEVSIHSMEGWTNANVTLHLYLVSPKMYLLLDIVYDDVVHTVTESPLSGRENQAYFRRSDYFKKTITTTITEIFSIDNVRNSDNTEYWYRMGNGEFIQFMYRPSKLKAGDVVQIHDLMSPEKRHRQMRVEKLEK